MVVLGGLFAPTEAALLAVLCLCLGYGLPLQISRGVGPACTKWDHVVDDVAGTDATALAGSWAWVCALECRRHAVAAVRGFGRK